MSGIEKIKRYIAITSVDPGRYQMNLDDVFALSHMTANDPTNAIITAFEYGKAKGYRAAKAEVRR